MPAPSRSSPAPPRSARASRPWWRRSAPTRSASTTSGVRVIHGQTDRIAFGMGAFASRVTVMTGDRRRASPPRRCATRRSALRRRDAAAAGRPSSTSSTARGARAMAPAPSIVARRSRPRAAPRRRSCAATRAGPRGRRLVLFRPHGLSLWRPHRGRAGRPRRPAASRSSAISSPTTSAGRSIRGWSKARSPAASRRGSAARCSRSSATTSAASRWR